MRMLTKLKPTKNSGIPTRVHRMTVGQTTGWVLWCQDNAKCCPAGAYARVFRGLYKASKVAVKVVHDWDTSMEEDGLPLEVIVMQGISHPNIVQLRDYKLHLTGPGCQPRLWLVLEYCQGGTLAVRTLSVVVQG